MKLQLEFKLKRWQENLLLTVVVVAAPIAVAAVAVVDARHRDEQSAADAARIERRIGSGLAMQECAAYRRMNTGAAVDELKRRGGKSPCAGDTHASLEGMLDVEIEPKSIGGGR